MVRRIATFLVVGGTGFIVDFGCLWAAIELLLLWPIPARLLAFAISLLFTYALNRTVTFSDRDTSGYGKLGLYALASSISGTANIAVYVATLHMLPATSFAPYIAMPIGTSVGLGLNLLLYNYVVFRGLR